MHYCMMCMECGGMWLQAGEWVAACPYCGAVGNEDKRAVPVPPLVLRPPEKGKGGVKQ